MKKFIVLSIVLLMLAGFAITSSAQGAPAILIVKIADTEAAAPGETVTYTYTVTNDGDVSLSDVTVSDDPAGSATYVSGDDGNELLDLEEIWIFTIIDYIIPVVEAPEYLCNIATAEGLYEGDPVSANSNEVCIHTMGARTIGYWKNHLEDWCDLPEDSIFFEKTEETLLAYFPGNGIEEDGVNPLEMLRVQLLAAELNVACFDVGFDYSRYEGDLGGYGNIYDVIVAAEDFLSLNPPELWPTDKKEQREFRKDNADSLALKDVLDTFNNMGDEIFE